MSTKSRHLILKTTLVVMLGFGVLGGLFASGYAMDDPGGIKGLGIVALYVVPTVIAALLAWKKPTIGLPVLIVGTIAVVVTSLLDASDPMRWHTIWDDRGPILAVSGFSVSMAAAVYGYFQRTRLAGGLLLASCGVPLFAGVLLGTQEGPLLGGSTSAGVLPGLIAGIVYLLVGDE